MELTFSAQIFAVIAFTDEELDFLIECSEHHYDGAVNSQAKQGGCLYGAKNVNTWCNESSDPDYDKSRSYNFREIDRMVSALSMSPHMENKEIGFELRKKLFNTLKSINEKTELVNNLEILK